VADDAARRFAPHEEYVAIGCALELLGDGDPRRLELLVRRALSSLSDEVDGDEIAEAAEAAAHALDVEQGAEAACTMLADLVRNSQGATTSSVSWRLARLAEPYLRADRHDITAAIIRSAMLREADHNDPEHPGIMRDTSDRRELRSLLLSLPAFDQRFVPMPIASRAEAERLLASTPRRATDERGYRIVPMSALFCLGRHRQVAEDLEWSLTDAVERGWLLPVVSSSAFISRALCMLGDHDVGCSDGSRQRPPTSARRRTHLQALRVSCCGPWCGHPRLRTTSVPCCRSSIARHRGQAWPCARYGVSGSKDDGGGHHGPGPVIGRSMWSPATPRTIPHHAYCIDALWTLNCTDGLTDSS
jgi:hypothetical protein